MPRRTIGVGPPSSGFELITPPDDSDDDSTTSTNDETPVVLAELAYPELYTLPEEFLSVLYTKNWTSGWTTIEFYKKSGQTFLLLMKKSGTAKDGSNLHIYKMNSDGSIGDKVVGYLIRESRQHARTYQIDSKLYILRTGKQRKRCYVNEIDSEGKFGNGISQDLWWNYWNVVETYKAGGDTFLFLLKTYGYTVSNTNVCIDKINNDGSTGETLGRIHWSQGWTHVRPFVIGNTPYIFLLKQGNGIMKIFRVKSDGLVGSNRDEDNWTDGWSIAEFFKRGNTTYLLIMKTEGVGNDGYNTHIYKMNTNGSIGIKICAVTISGNWTHAKPFKVGDNYFLFLHKEQNGHIEIRDFNKVENL